VGVALGALPAFLSQVNSAGFIAISSVERVPGIGLEPA